MPAETTRSAPRADIAEFLPTVEVASFTRERVERVMLVSVGFGCIAIGTQALFVAFGDVTMSPGWRLLLLLLAFAPMVTLVASFFVGRFVAAAAIVYLSAFTLVLLLWPLATSGQSSATTAAQPWVYFLLNVATVAAVLGLPMGMQITATVGVPLLYGVVRMTELGFRPDQWLPTALDVMYSLILGTVLLALAWTFRSAASDVDERRVHAVSSYARAVAVAASERERVAVAALMHDSVLAALIAAARADSPREQDLAVSMAREALTRLANTDRDANEGSDAPVPVQALIEGLATAMPAGEHVVADVAGTGPQIPGRVAHALVLAATQAISNAVAHADGAGLQVRVDARTDPGSVRVRVRDEGPGFDIDAVPADRLGIRASILARVSAFGGRAVIESGPDGTVVDLEWDGTPR